MILKYHYRKATMVSLNYQSINANFDHFKLFFADINRNSPISVMCIQETCGYEERNRYDCILTSKLCNCV